MHPNPSEEKLSNNDPEDVCDCILEVFESFGRDRFPLEGPIDITTLGDLYQFVEKRIGEKHSPECTTQQAFYKLRAAIAEVLQLDKNSITPDASLAALFPSKNRWRKMREVQQLMGIKTKLVEMNNWLFAAFVVMFLGSIVLFFFNWVYALIAFGSLLLLQRVARIFNNKLCYPDLREAAEYLMIFEYNAMRRNPDTVNTQEVQQVINQVFIKKLSIGEKNLTPEEKLFQ